MGDLMIEVQNLTKTYPGGVLAVDGISFEVHEGEIFGFLGPNGAGKSTTIGLITTLEKATSGTVRVAGFDVGRDPEKVRRLLGYVHQSKTGIVPLDVGFTVRDNIRLFAELQGIKRSDQSRNIEEAAEALGLTGSLDKTVRSLSGGWQRRVEIATALVHRPALLFLDEPTTGMDPSSRRSLWEYLKRERQDGTTIFLTTQNMQEADELADRVAFIKQGKIVVIGTPEDLKSRVKVDQTETLATLEEVFLKHVDSERNGGSM